MAVDLLNKHFTCHLILNESDLNDIVNKINEIIQDQSGGGTLTPEQLAALEEQLALNLSSSGTVLAFAGFADEEAALDSYELIRDSTSNPPNGWSTTSNVNTSPGNILFMISAQVIGGTLQELDGHIWQGPYRLGSSNTTDGTGADDDDYNYIYCRTDSGSPNISTLISNGTAFVKLIEENPGKVFAIGNTLSNQGTTIEGALESSLKNKWGDHPLGITQTLPYEWQVAFKYNTSDDTWDYAYGPICISHWGRNGLDGDGFEYIFYLVGENNNPDNPTLNPPYSGRIGKNGSTTYTNVTVTGELTPYQQSDFIPTGWHDLPQAVDNVRTKLYVSTRKRLGELRGLEITNPWTAFTEPKIWNIYASDGYKLTLDNDTVFVDDNIVDAALLIVSTTNLWLWDGDLDISLGSSVKITHSNEFRTDIAPGYINNLDEKVPIDWGDSVPYNYAKGFYLRKIGNNDLEEGTDQIIFEVTKSINGVNKTSTRIQTFEVKNFNNGEAYMLQVTPNTLYTKKNSEGVYELYNIDSITVSAISTITNLSTGKKIKKTNNLNYGDLYIKVLDNLNKDLPGLTIGEIANTNNVSITFGNIGTPITGIKYILVELWLYVDGTNDVRVDVETIDFSVKGDDGTIDNLEQQVLDIVNELNIVETYTITGTNDNAVIDNNTISEQALKSGTRNVLTVRKGNNTISNSDLKFKINNINLGENSSKLDVYYYNGTDYIYYDPSNTNWIIPGDYLLFVILPKWDAQRKKISELLSDMELSVGNGNDFYYEVEIEHNSKKVGTKRFNLNILNISTDGSYYKLNILNDVLSYNSLEQILSTEAVSKIEIYSVNLQGIAKSIITDNFIIYPITVNNKVSGNFYIDFGSLENYVLKQSGLNYYEISLDLSTGRHVLTLYWSNNDGSVSYSETGYDITLYKYIDRELKLLDTEHIDCIKDGTNGFNSVIVRLYKRSDTEIYNPGILSTTYYDFEHKKLYKTNNNGELSNEVTSSNLNEWSSSVSNATTDDNSNLKLYMTAATAGGNSNIREIASSEWSDPIPVSDDGSTPDYNIRTVYLYLYNSGTPDVIDSDVIYHFSDNVFGTKDGQMTEIDAWKLSITETLNENLWETHATAVSLSDFDLIKSSEWSTPSIVSTKQEVTAGETGKMFYMMGIWDPEKEYSIDDLRIPIVFYDDGETNSSGNTGHYYYLNPETEDNENLKRGTIDTGNGVSKGDIPKSAKFNHDGNNSTANIYVWLRADDFGLVITEGIFSEFAKLGSAIISGDYIMSQHGKLLKINTSNSSILIDNTTSIGTNGVSINSKPAYTYFYSYEDIDLSPLRWSYAEGITIGDSYKFNENTRLYGYITFINNNNVEFTNNVHTIRLKDINNNSFVDFNVISTKLNGDEKLFTVVSNTINNTSNFEFVYGGSGTISVMIRINVKTGYYINNNLYTSFHPNWQVDLKTGKMVAGLGNFVVDLNGNVNIKGNLTAGSTINSGTINSGTINGGVINGTTINGSTINTSSSGRRINIGNGIMNVYNDLNLIGLSIGWDNGDPYLLIAKVNSNGDIETYLDNGQTKNYAYKLTYDGLKQLESSNNNDFTTDAVIKITLICTNNGLTVNDLSNANKWEDCYQYIAARSNINGLFLNDSDATSLTRLINNEKYFKTNNITDILNDSSNYIIDDGYYIGDNETNLSNNVYSRLLYNSTGGILNVVGAVYYKNSNWCNSDGTTGYGLNIDINNYVGISKD